MVSTSSCALPGPHLMSCVLLSQLFCCLFRLFEVGFLYSPPLLLSLRQPQHRRPPDDPPACNICPVLFKSFIFSQTRSRWAPLGRVVSGGLLSNEREGSVCILSESQVRDEHSSAVVSSCLICLLSRVLDNKTVTAGTLALIRSRGFCKGCAAQPSTDLNPTRRCGCFISTLSNGRRPDSLLALMTAAVPRPRGRNAMMFM